MDRDEALTFTLFRAQVFLPEQLPLFNQGASPTAILMSALLEKPTVKHQSGNWHIGNVLQLTSFGLYFAIGRQLPRRLGTLDQAGDFRNEDTLVAPNTHVLLDLKYQVVAIAKNTDLAPEPAAVARKLQRLLQATEVVQSQRCSVSIDLINDPSEFVDVLLSAVAVTKFQVSFCLPNVWDADEDFQRPFQNTALELGSRESTASFKADDLDRKKLVSLTRAAAAVGKKAKAWVRRGKRKKATMITPTQDPATISTEPMDPSRPVRWADDSLEAVREYYESIRDRE